MLEVDVRKEFALRGKKINLSKDEVLNILSRYDEKTFTEKRQSSNYFVVIEEKFIPIKKALMLLLKHLGYDLTILDFTTQDAVRIFRKLGFSIVTGKGKKDSLKPFVGAIHIEGNALEDKKNLYEW